MEQTITIDGKKVTFKADGVTPLRYRMEFKRDYFADIVKMTSVLKSIHDGTDIDFDKLDTSVFYDIIYLLAKTADNEIDNIFDVLRCFQPYVGIVHF